METLEELLKKLPTVKMIDGYCAYVPHLTEHKGEGGFVTYSDHLLSLHGEPFLYTYARHQKGDTWISVKGRILGAQGEAFQIDPIQEDERPALLKILSTMFDERVGFSYNQHKKL